MLQNGLSPPAASPAENVTACSSSIPTSKNCSGHSHDLGIHPGEVEQYFPEDVLIPCFQVRGRQEFAGGGVELARSVPYHRVRFRRGEAFALYGQTMQDARAPDVFEFLQGVHYILDVIAVYRAEIAESKGFEEVSSRFLDEPGLEAPDPALQEVPEAVVAEEIPHPGFEAVVRTARGDFEQVFVHRAYVVVNRLVVVVEQYEQVGPACSGVVQALEGQSTRHRPVPDQRYGLAVQVLDLGGLRESQRR